MPGVRSLSFLFVLVLAGCSKPAEVLIPVAGTVTVKKQPLASGTVVFHPDRDKGNQDKREPRATITSDSPGRYQLMTDNQPGAPTGWYRVTVHAFKTATSSVAPPEWLIDQRYANEKTSGLAVEVVKDAPARTYDFDVEPPN